MINSQSSARYNLVRCIVCSTQFPSGELAFYETHAELLVADREGHTSSPLRVAYQDILHFRFVQSESYLKITVPRDVVLDWGQENGFARQLRSFFEDSEDGHTGHAVARQGQGAVLLTHLSAYDIRHFLQCIGPIITANRRARSTSRISVTQPLSVGLYVPDPSAPRSRCSEGDGHGDSAATAAADEEGQSSDEDEDAASHITAGEERRTRLAEAATTAEEKKEAPSPSRRPSLRQGETSVVSAAEGSHDEELSEQLARLEAEAVAKDAGGDGAYGLLSRRQRPPQQSPEQHRGDSRGMCGMRAPPSGRTQQKRKREKAEEGEEREDRLAALLGPALRPKLTAARAHARPRKATRWERENSSSAGGEVDSLTVSMTTIGRAAPEHHHATTRQARGEGVGTTQSAAKLRGEGGRGPTRAAARRGTPVLLPADEDGETTEAFIPSQPEKKEEDPLGNTLSLDSPVNGQKGELGEATGVGVAEVPSAASHDIYPPRQHQHPQQRASPAALPVMVGEEGSRTTRSSSGGGGAGTPSAGPCVADVLLQPNQQQRRGLRSTPPAPLPAVPRPPTAAAKEHGGGRHAPQPSLGYDFADVITSPQRAAALSAPPPPAASPPHSRGSRRHGCGGGRGTIDQRGSVAAAAVRRDRQASLLFLAGLELPGSARRGLGRSRGRARGRGRGAAAGCVVQAETTLPKATRSRRGTTASAAPPAPPRSPSKGDLETKATPSAPLPSRKRAGSSLTTRTDGAPLVGLVATIAKAAHAAHALASSRSDPCVKRVDERDCCRLAAADSTSQRSPARHSASGSLAPPPLQRPFSQDSQAPFPSLLLDDDDEANVAHRFIGPRDSAGAAGGSRYGGGGGDGGKDTADAQPPASPPNTTTSSRESSGGAAAGAIVMARSPGRTEGAAPMAITKAPLPLPHPSHAPAHQRDSRRVPRYPSIARDSGKEERLRRAVRCLDVISQSLTTAREHEGELRGILLAMRGDGQL